MPLPFPPSPSAMIPLQKRTLPSCNGELEFPIPVPAGLLTCRADYDLMTFDKPHANDSYLISSYVYRKALIRKHQLHTTVAEYLAKSSHRGESSVLAAPASGGVGGIPKGWTVDVQFADELDELLMDDLYELQETMDANAQLGDDEERQWFILKPGFADRAQGIRMFSTEDEL